jgi:hypothetical protein
MSRYVGMARDIHIARGVHAAAIDFERKSVVAIFRELAATLSKDSVGGTETSLAFCASALAIHRVCNDIMASD